MQGKRTVRYVVNTMGDSARARLLPHFRMAGCGSPPESVTLLAFKSERVLEVWAQADSDNTHIRRYPIRGASGGIGPKLREGDLQVPEGLYRIIALNPNSAFHLSLKLDYPNEFDRVQATADDRTDLGGDIFIHGGSASIGCIAIGDEPIEELFVLAADVGIENITVIIAPHDFRRTPRFPEQAGPVWAETLYAEISAALRQFPPPLDHPTAKEVS